MLRLLKTQLNQTYNCASFDLSVQELLVVCK